MQAERLGAEGQHGRTPLHVACQAGDLDTICLLISEKKCEKSGRDTRGDAPIHIAAFCGHEDVVKLLVWGFGCSAEERNLNGETPVHAACRGGHVDIVYGGREGHFRLRNTDRQIDTAHREIDTAHTRITSRIYSDLRNATTDSGCRSPLAKHQRR